MRVRYHIGAIGIVGTFPTKEDEEADLAVGPTKPIADLFGMSCHDKAVDSFHVRNNLQLSVLN